MHKSTRFNNTPETETLPRPKVAQGYLKGLGWVSWSALVARGKLGNRNKKMGKSWENMESSPIHGGSGLKIVLNMELQNGFSIASGCLPRSMSGGFIHCNAMIIAFLILCITPSST